jgi:hypothetical protein
MAKKSAPYPQFAGLELSEKEQDFVFWYCHPEYGYNATRSYAQAFHEGEIENYSSTSTLASRLLKKVDIMTAIDRERARRLARHEELADSILRQWYIMATVDITQFFDIHGHTVSLKELSEIPPYMLNCIKSLKTTAHGIEVIFHDKDRALENLAKALGMFRTVVHNTNEPYESLVQKIDRQRREIKNKAAQE